VGGVVEKRVEADDTLTPSEVVVRRRRRRTRRELGKAQPQHSSDVPRFHLVACKDDYYMEREIHQQAGSIHLLNVSSPGESFFTGIFILQILSPDN
jgi:hypothetical protein